MRYLPLIVFGCSVLFLTSCGDHDEASCVFVPDVSKVNVNVDLEHLEDSVVNFKTKQQLVDFLTRHPVMRDYFFNRRNYPNDSVYINTLYRKFNHPAFDTLLIETKKIFGDGQKLQEQFHEAFTNLKYYYPDIVPPKIQTVISGLETDLFISDSLIIVGLDYYLGRGAKYRPKIYDYLLSRYEPEDIVPSCMLIYGIDDQFNKTNLSDKTVLADMISYGKSFYFAKHMLPCTPDSVFLWYSTADIKGARANEDLIWYRLIEDEVLYSTSNIPKQKFLAERPKTLEVGEKCPGRIAQWVGWQIVKKYMDTHSDVSLPQLMHMNNAQRILKGSHYKPVKK